MGRKAQRLGDAFEQALLVSFRHYLGHGELAFGMKIGPPTKVFGKRKIVRIVGTGPPDFLFILNSGHVGMMEAKSTRNKNRLTYRARMHQFHALLQARSATGVSLYGYIVQWRNENEVRWFPVEDLPYGTKGGQHTVFVREEGLLVPPFSWEAGIPNWLPTIEGRV